MTIPHFLFDGIRVYVREVDGVVLVSTLRVSRGTGRC